MIANRPPDRSTLDTDRARPSHLSTTRVFARQPREILKKAAAFFVKESETR